MLFDYYSTAVGLGLMLMLVLLTILLCDEVLKARERRCFILAFSVCIIELILDWHLTYLQQTNSNRLFLLNFGTALMYIIGSSINYIMTWIILEEKSSRALKIFWTMVLLNIILSFSIFFTDAIFYFDDTYKFRLGDYFFIIVIQIIVACFIMFYSWYKTIKKYQSKSSYILRAPLKTQ